LHYCQKLEVIAEIVLLGPCPTRNKVELQSCLGNANNRLTNMASSDTDDADDMIISSAVLLLQRFIRGVR